MAPNPPQPDELESLYIRAFQQYGARALWNMRPVDDPTARDALAITQSLRTYGDMDGWRSRPANAKRNSRALTRLCSLSG